MKANKRPSQSIRTSPFDKYFYYSHSVQSPEHDAQLIWKMMKKSWKGPLPKAPTLQEDFCGTAALCYEWALLGSQHAAAGVDIDATALQWGAKNLANDLPLSVVKRVHLIHGDVMENHSLRPDVICALNFSYFFMKERDQLKRYFQSCKKSLTRHGILVLDAFGGPDYEGPHRERRRNSQLKFNYWWNVEKFDAVNHSISCHIDYQRDGERTRQKVFSYDWRLWSIPELTDLLKESGFTSITYWAEGLDKQGRGNGTFRPIKSEIGCTTWVIYIVAC
jgi:SAM-dependent methyltransferase